ncbi:unnamed protein product [Acanthosepion pharaonis]|uniref:Uncharacterized protein n=1 Tax=Acanthosepion pharaonis TaxID=158019 RepID=A0A812B5T1_ACAPH|nr:unnamed protein product [Sepia pharaonis]
MGKPMVVHRSPLNKCPRLRSGFYPAREQEASLIRDFDAPSQVDQAQQLTGPSSSSSSFIRSPLFKAPLTPLFATAFPLRRQLTPAASSTPPAHPCGPLLTSRYLFQHPLTIHPPFANKDTISIVYNGPSAFVILLCYCHLLAFVSPILVVRSIGTHTSRPAATTYQLMTDH